MPGLSREIIRFKKLLKTFPDDHILIEGSRGTGKSFFLQIFEEHHNGSGSIRKINCATIPQDLAASQLFGYVAGAYTGANKDTGGLIDEVNAFGKKHNKGIGLLILEELNSLSRADQAKLLVFMETSEYYPVGSWKPKKAKVKIIATSNFESEYKNRQDLIDRFGIVVDVPPLSARREDIFYFIAKKYPELRMNTYGLMHLYNHNWPGNLRDLDRYLKEVEINTKWLTMYDDSMAQKLSEATALLGAAGMTRTMFDKLKEECFDRVLPTQFGQFYGVNDEEWNLDEFCNRMATEPLAAPTLSLQFSTNSIESKSNTPLATPLNNKKTLQHNDENFEIHFEIPIVVLSQFTNRNFEPDGVTRGVDTRMISKFFRMLFGNVDCPGPISEQELFGGFPQEYRFSERNIYPLPFKPELNITKSSSALLDYGLTPLFPDHVDSPVFSEFAEYCRKVRELKMNGNASVVIDASNVANFLLDGDTQSRFTDVVLAIKTKVGHGWQERIAKMLQVSPPTMSRWAKKNWKIVEQ